MYTRFCFLFANGYLVRFSYAFFSHKQGEIWTPRSLKKLDSDACFHNNYGFRIFFCLFFLIKNLAFGGNHVTTESLMTPLTVGWNHETPLKLYCGLWPVGHYHFAVRLWVQAKSHTINSEREPERKCELGSVFRKYFKLSKFVRAKIESKRKKHYKMIM